jgi:hypothetical protein
VGAFVNFCAYAYCLTLVFFFHGVYSINAYPNLFGIKGFVVVVVVVVYSINDNGIMNNRC